MLLSQLVEALSPKEKKKIAITAAELMGVDSSKILNITKMWNTFHWNASKLASKDVDGEKFNLLGEQGPGRIRVVHLLRSDTHPNMLFSTKAMLEIFANGKEFGDAMMHHLEKGDAKYARDALDQYRQFGVIPKAATKFRNEISIANLRASFKPGDSAHVDRKVAELQKEIDSL